MVETPKSDLFRAIKGFRSFCLMGSTTVSDCDLGDAEIKAPRVDVASAQIHKTTSLGNANFLKVAAFENGRAQAKPKALRCSDQSRGKRVSAIILLAVSATGWRPFRMAMMMSGARKFRRISRAA